MSEKRKSTSPSAIQMKNRRKAITVGEKLDVRNPLEKSALIFYIYRNVRYARIITYNS